MKSIVFKITLAVSLLIIIATIAIAFISGHEMSDRFEQYMHEAAALNDPFPTVKDGQILKGPAENRFINNIYLDLVLVGVPVTFLALLIGLVIAGGTTKSIRKLSKGALEIAKGNFTYRVKIKGGDEMSLLADSFNSMAEELSSAQVLRKQFFADAAHELKTPIAVIKGNLEAMIDDVVPMNKTSVASLLEEAEFLNSIIGDIKYLALADSGQLILNKREVNICEIVDACASRLKVAATTRGLDFTTEHKSGDSIIAFVDAERIEQVIYNLLINAGKYTDSGGRLGIITEKVFNKGTGYFKITVWDTGRGMSAFDVPHIFERFYRADKSRDRKTGGIGLGLAIVKKIVELHNGQISVESELGKGSKFYVVVPVI